MPANRTNPGTVPTSIGRFEVRALLGSGGFGSVYRAHDPLLGREVALKVAHAGLVENPTQRERFLREGRAAAKLRHPHLVAVYDAGCEDGAYYMAAAYVEGRTLAKARKQGELDLRQSAAIVRQLAEALAYAHRQGIVHRDVKPANVLLDARNQPHLTDFGIAHQQGSAEKLTHDGAILGTPAYMAPEQAAGRQGDPLPASDQYSLGVVLYELLTGQPPFSGPPVAILHGVLHQEPPAPRRVNSAVPRDLERICLKAMAKRPEDRYADCREFAEDLRRFLEGDPVKARPLSIPERIWRWSKHEPKLAVAGAVAALALLAAVLVPSVWSVLLANANAQNERKTAQYNEQKAEAEQARKNAEEERKKALKKKEEAEKAAKQLKADTHTAEVAKKAAEDEARKAAEATQQSERRKAALPRFQYAADIQLAQYALEAGDETSLRKNLENPEGAGKPELRGFEWRHLLPSNRVLSFSLPKPEGRLMLLFPPPRGSRSLIEVRLVSVKDKGQLRARIQDLRKPVETAGVRLDWHMRLQPKPRGFLGADGHSMITKNTAAALEIWDLANGRPRALLAGHSRFAIATSFSHDGSRLATLHENKALRVWDLGDKRVKLQLPEAGVAALALSPKGDVLATVEGAETVIREVKTGNKLTALPHAPLGKDPPALAFSHDGKRLAVSTGTEVKVWDVAGWKEQASLPEQGVADLEFLRDGRTLLLADRQFNKVTLWDVTDKKRDHKFPPVHGRAGAALSPDLKLLAINEGNALSLWDPASGEQRLSVPLSRKDAAGLLFLDDKELAVVFEDGKVDVWPRPLLERATVLGKPGGRVESLAFAPKGELAAAAGDAVTWWDLGGAQPRTTLPRPDGTALCTVSPDGGSVAAATKESVLLGRQGDKALASFWKGGEARCLAFSRDGKLLAAGLATGDVQVWETVGSKPRLTGKGHKTAVRALAFTPDGGWLATADAGQVLLWDLASGQSSPLPAPRVVCLCFSTDGKTLCTGEETGTLTLWDRERKQARVTIKAAHRGGIRAVAYSSDGRTLASGGDDSVVRLWEAVTGGELLTFAGPSTAVTALAFAAADTALAAGHANGDVRLWYALPEKAAEQPPPPQPGVK